jgi:hypothetical protein
MKNIFLFGLGQLLPYFLLAQFNQPLSLVIPANLVNFNTINLGENGVLVYGQDEKRDWKFKVYSLNFQLISEFSRNAAPDELVNCFYDKAQKVYWLFQVKKTVKILKLDMEQGQMHEESYELPLDLPIKKIFGLGDVVLLVAGEESEQNLLLKTQLGERIAQVIAQFPQQDWTLNKIEPDESGQQVLLSIQNKRLHQEKLKIFSPRLGLRDAVQKEHFAEVEDLTEQRKLSKLAENYVFASVKQGDSLLLAYIHTDIESSTLFISSKKLIKNQNANPKETQNLSRFTSNEINNNYTWRLEYWQGQHFLLIGKRDYFVADRPNYLIYKLSYEWKDNLMGKKDDD